ncbi:hypothetical protein [Streptomyces sp. NPDC051909]|uniref:hypothetical protein n=1 Tax=Streptomyces sp. NPDC051909 TaxID=3154944 RepID=UPI003448FB42
MTAEAVARTPRVAATVRTGDVVHLDEGTARTVCAGTTMGSPIGGLTLAFLFEDGGTLRTAAGAEGHETNRSGMNRNPFVAIQGYAIRLEDKTCKPAKANQKPVRRTDMFIQSEMLADGSQKLDTPWDPDTWWAWDGPGDYSSNGCIKLAPNDLKDLFAYLGRAGWPKNLTLRVG